MSTLWQESLDAFRNSLASSAPVPGGGSAAMVSATLGCGLLIMAADIGSEKENADPAIAAVQLPLRSLLAKLSEHADKDVEAYEGYVAARRLPKSTQTELAERDARLLLALQDAAAAPVAAAEDVLRALEIAKTLAPLSHLGILSDVGAGAALLHGALRAALFTLMSNMRLMKDEQAKERYAEIYDELSSRGEKIYDEVRAKVDSRLAS